MQSAEPKPLEVILNEILARVRQFTNADGAAIAIRDGEFVVTRATTGGIAPDLGARMSIQGSFTGLCMEKRTMLHCEDSDADARVDAAVCRQLNTRSFVVVPVEGTKQPQGVLAAFSASPHAFTRTDIAVLKTAADQIRHALANIPAAENPATVAPVEQKKVESKKADLKGDGEILKARLATLQEKQPAPATDRPAAAVVTMPSTVRPAQTNSPERSATAAAAARIEVQPIAAPVPKPEKSTALVTLAEAIEAPAKTEPAPQRQLDETLPEGFREQYLGWKGFETTEDSPRFSKKWIVLAAAICLLLIGGVALWMRRTPPLQHNAAAIVPGSSTVSAAEAAAPPPSQPVQVSMPVPTPVPTTARTTEVSPSVATSAPKEKTIAVAKQPAMVVDSSSAKPRTPVVPDAEAPQVSMASSNLSILPDTKPVVPGAPKPPPVRVSALEPSELIHKVVPLFPRFTNAPAGTTQTVVLRARVLPDGTVADVQLVQGRAEFGESAKSAVKQWRYKPAQMDGKPVESAVTVTLNFKR